MRFIAKVERQSDVPRMVRSRLNAERVWEQKRACGVCSSSLANETSLRLDFTRTDVPLFDCDPGQGIGDLRASKRAALGLGNKPRS